MHAKKVQCNLGLLSNTLTGIHLMAELLHRGKLDKQDQTFQSLLQENICDSQVDIVEVPESLRGDAVKKTRFWILESVLCNI